MLVCHVPHLLQQLEAGDDFLDVIAEATEVLLDISKKDLLVVCGGSVELLQRPFARVVKYVAGRSHERGIIELGGLHLRLLEANLLQHGFLCRFKEGVEPPEDDHRQDDVSILPADVNIPQAVIGDRPDERNELVVSSVIHR